MLVLSKESYKKEPSFRDNFIELATQLTRLMNDVGIRTQASHDDFELFDQLTSQEQASAIEQVRFYYDLCMEQVRESQSLRDSKKFTWRALVKLGLSPLPDLLDRIENDDIVEIYNAEQVQLFRNLEFFDLCSYTIEELFCFQWWRLFHRDERVSKEILTVVGDLYNRKYPEGIASPLPKHLVVESLSRDKFNIDFFMKYMGPLYKNKRIEALICIEQATLV